MWADDSEKGEVTIGDVQISEGKARVFGGLTFHLLYVSDGERRRICQLSGELPDRRDDPSRWSDRGDKVCITWEVEDLNLHLINSQSWACAAIVTLHAWIEELCDPCRADGNRRRRRRRGKKAEIPRG